MSTDTKYFNSSRLMSASSRNKTDGVTRLDKKQTQAERKNKVRHEAGDVPQPQLLPNGGKPDFGHSSSRRKQKNISGRLSSSGSDGKKQGEKQSNTQQVTENLKQLFIEPEDAVSKSKAKSSSGKSRKARQSKSPVSSSSSAGSTSGPTGVVSPELQAAQVPHQNMNPVCSPLFVRPGLYPPASPSSVQQNPIQGFSAHPYGNYSLSSPAPVPQFMSPQAPLVNPMYPQIPLAQLPVMYKALDIQQQQLHQQHQQQIPPNYFPQYQFQQPQQLQQPQQFSHPNPAIPYSLPPTASYCNSPPETAAKPLEREIPRKSKGKNNATSTCFAGASFASSDPKVTKLPKPSFTKA